MSATTENTDQSGEVLIELIRELQGRLDALEPAVWQLVPGVAGFRGDVDRAIRGINSRLNGVESDIRAIGPIPAFPTSELISFGTGPARVEFMVYDDPDALEYALRGRLRATEADGWTFESVQPFMLPGEYGACVVFRLPVPETEAAP